MKVIEAILDRSWAYNLWSTVHLKPRIDLVFEMFPELNSNSKILEVACGPATAFAHFKHTQYVGVDFSPEYIETAKKKLKGESARFLVGDLEKKLPLSGEEASFDLVLLNGSLHHLSDSVVEKALENMAQFVRKDGHILIIDQVVDLEHTRSMRNFLIKLDRGDFTRTEERIREMIEKRHFKIVAENSRNLSFGPIVCWKYCAFKAKPLFP